MTALNLYSIFHLNLAYSSIEEDQRADVVRKCYWPLLELVERLDLPLGIEASGYTLEAVHEIDPSWIASFKKLLHSKKCEFIGSGHMQIIGPLVPAEVNTHNQRIGLTVYEELLAVRPTLVLVNEQAYSAGLIQHYLDAGYKAIVMEWNNPARFHAEWPKEIQYLPQRARGLRGESIPLIWNNAIAFQKFQRYAHGDMELEDYIHYIGQHVGDKPRAFPLYANDAEIFDFRPGRYHTEASLHADGEWSRIAKIFEALKSDKNFSFVLPGYILTLIDLPMAGNVLQLETPEQPIPVKKQNKYCISRWAVTGKADTLINSACFGIFNTIQEIENLSSTEAHEVNDLWKELCYLWGSDFRTHITEARFDSYLKRLQNAQIRAGLLKERLSSPSDSSANNRESTKADPFEKNIHCVGCNMNSAAKDTAYCQIQNNILLVETELIRIKLNCRKGMAIDAVTFKSVCDNPLIGTLPHGFYEDIELGADFYTGHLVAELPGKPKVTDLNQVIAETQDTPDLFKISGIIHSVFGEIHKTISVYHHQPRISIQYDLDWEELPLASLRAGIVTFLPDRFEKDSLFYRTHNGGYEPETFYLKGHEVLHDKAVSHLISLGQCIGATNGWVEAGDRNMLLRISSDKKMLYSVPLINYRETDSSYFLRVLHSLTEIDDTRKSTRLFSSPSSFRVDITARALRER